MHGELACMATLFLAALSAAAPTSAYNLRGSRMLTNPTTTTSAASSAAFSSAASSSSSAPHHLLERAPARQLIRHYRAAQRSPSLSTRRAARRCDGSLVSFSGLVTGGASLTDAVVPSVMESDALLLMRSIEILQWKETSEGEKDNKKWTRRVVRLAAADCKHVLRQPIGPLGRVLGQTARRDEPQGGGASVQFGDGQTVVRARRTSAASICRRR